MSVRIDGKQRTYVRENWKFRGVNLSLSQPHDAKGAWIGQGEILKQVLACWIVVDDDDLPLTPRLVGPPGIGKTALAMAAAKVREQELLHLPMHRRHAT